jgi:hypothetical protein
MTTEERFWSKVKIGAPDECWEWQSRRDAWGYGSFTMGRETLAHRTAYVLTTGTILPGMYIIHSCDNPGCVNPSHLRMGTPKDNSHDRKIRNREADHRGEFNGRAKLTWEHVHIIRQMHASGFRSWKRLGEWFGVSGQQVGRIIENKEWISPSNK